MCQNQLFAVLQDLFRFWSKQAHSFWVPFSSFGNGNLDILGRGVLGDFDSGRKVLDGPFGVCGTCVNVVEEGGWRGGLLLLTILIVIGDTILAEISSSASEGD